MAEHNKVFNFLLGDPRHAESVNKSRRRGPITENPALADANMQIYANIRYDDEKVIRILNRWK